MNALLRSISRGVGGALLTALLLIGGHTAGAAEMPAAMSTMPQGHGMDMPPADAPASTGLRDPHAYADGFTLTSGAPVLPGGRRMHLDDEQAFGSVLVDRFETVHSNEADVSAYALQAWYGRDFDRFVLKVDGDYSGGSVEDARTELFWQHALAPFWDLQAGLRYDSGVGHERGWLALGIEGLAPYWFDVNVTAYVGDRSRAALLFESEYDVLLTQRLILQPRLEADIYSRDDVQRGLGAGLANLTAGLRLRYEIRRQLAPYIGVEWRGSYAGTADYRRQGNDPVAALYWLAGLRFWF